MQRRLDHLIYSWLHQLKIPVSASFLKEQLFSHPEFPSLSIITDTLDLLAIENTAIKISKDQLHEIPVPFLAHLHSNRGEFVIINNRNDLDKQFPGFFDNWSGVVVVAERPQDWQHQGNEAWLKKERLQKAKATIAISLLLCFVLTGAFLSFNVRNAVLLLIASLGLLISWFIVSKDLGIENKMADKVCGQEADCDSVIQSKAAKLPFGLGWSDIGMMWFSFMLLTLLTSSFTGNNAASFFILSILSAASLPFSVFSIYYQWKVVKKWCRLCLMTVLLLVAQFIVLAGPLTQIGTHVPATIELLLPALLASLVVMTWLGVKTLLLINRDLERDHYPGLRFISNPSLFIALLERQRSVDFTALENDLQLGNPHSPLQITVACNPYCRPCAQAHITLHELVERNDIGLSIRFMINAANLMDPKTIAVQHMYRHLSWAGKQADPVYKRKLLHDWFSWMEYDKFSATYPADTSEVTETLAIHQAWTKKARIQHTPTIFINGLEMPDAYNPGNLAMMMTGLLDHVTETKKNEKDLVYTNG